MLSVIAGAILNGILEKGLSKKHIVKLDNIPGSTGEKIIDDLDRFLKENPDDCAFHIEI